MNLYIVRNGRTNYDLLGKLAGQIDVALNKKGVDEAFEARDKLKNIRFNKVYSSPLHRALLTAQLIRYENIILDDRLMPRNKGDLEGKLLSEIDNTIDFNNPNETRYNIEPLADFRNRINGFLDEITANSNEDDNVLVVTHSGVGIYMRCYLEGEPVNGNYDRYQLKNGEILEYHLEKKKRL